MLMHGRKKHRLLNEWMKGKDVRGDDKLNERINVLLGVAMRFYRILNFELSLIFQCPVVFEKSLSLLKFINPLFFLHLYFFDHLSQIN